MALWRKAPIGTKKHGPWVERQANGAVQEDGGPFMAVNCGSDVSFEGAENIKVFNLSDWAERGFCGKCGMHLFYRIKRNSMHVMPAGLFGDAIPFEFSHEVFVDENPGLYDFSNETEKMTGEECFAKFAEGCDE